LTAAAPSRDKSAMPSFDIVSKTDVHEVDNAIAGVAREIATRFDFKGSKCTIERKENAITILADDDLKLKQMQELLRGYMTRRKLDASALDFKEPERASGNALRQTVDIKQGVGGEISRRIVKDIKESKLKVQVAIQGDELRVTGKKIDDLQAAIARIRALKIEQPLQFVNMRS
jgi:uncharacterized protein YajQ (UPF0234 family)